ncbi:trans-1,2-dihydrobenzene-1,2-diol dehydrogenase-like [Crassostrea angulata]|uniref:trans-1,2-dihydrobenzene-1,2-diol dehydrogenase-like n=1 Tax=Magallana angulata TaxID=2784310 RepID=UPI0022B14BC6|nr:trans-1,2-dihydrobenzene-1,2-diol dehydrogenase-like [Crassostrea angulata]XP_052704843.1 trans-1,2-dihydrobenzene-1,2-diol dehydrogenase-like [Crassostrea angulata]XP_052704844.1 trans-1,2-dihydrobenzene-1,2-diol dehydrogenase-like [Crassostrea angulata]XP_052704845.1 trans-1,2-dihydrobenzene-1,2-diol dehydrogenase-like [Crassostrea angulata]
MVLRWGICGAGLICNDFVSALLAPPNNVHEVVCVGARSLARAQEFADRFGIKKAYGSYDEVATDPNVDVVYIGLIPCYHVKLSKQILKAGKNVLCEKPVAVSLNQFLEVQQVAKDYKRFFMEAIWSRCFPIYRKIKEEIHSGNLGEILHVQCQFCYSVVETIRFKKPELGGGGLHEVGIYTIQLATMVFNNEKPLKITADASFSDQGVDQNGCMTLTYKNGGKAVLVYSTLFQGKNSAIIYGSKGKIEIDDTFWSPVSANLPSGKITNEIPCGPAQNNFPNTGGLRYEADCVKKCLEAGNLECSEVTFADSQAINHIIDEVVRLTGIHVQW